MAIGETVITIVGNLTAAPELRTTGQGAPAADQSSFGDFGKPDPEPDF